MTKTKQINAFSTEICQHCGESVREGQGKYAGRIEDVEVIEDRIARNVAFPIGTYVCKSCDEFMRGIGVYP